MNKETLEKQELRYYSALFRAHNEAIPDAILIVDTKGKMLSSNRKFQQLWNIPQDIMINKDDTAALQFAMTQLIDPEGFIKRVNYCYAHPGERTHEDVLFKDGRIIERFGYPVVGEDGTGYGWAWYFRDVTAQRRLEQSIMESESRFRTMVEQAPIGIGLLTGRDMIFESINKPLLQLIGRQQDIIGKPLLSVIPELEAQRNIMGILENVFDSGQPYAGAEVPVILLNGEHPEKRYFNLSYTPLFEGKLVKGILNVTIDVTAQVTARQKIQDAEERARLAIDSAKLGTYEIDLQTNAIVTSDRFKQIWGVEEDMPRSAYANLIHPDDMATRESAQKESIQTGQLLYEARLMWKDGSIRWVKVNGKVLYDVEGKAHTLLGVIQDITEQKNTQQQKDNFIAMASHELKTPVTSIKAYAQGIEHLLIKKGHPYEAEMIGKLDKQVNRLTNLITDLLNITKINAGRLEYHKSIFDFNQLVNEMTEELQRTTSQHQIHISLGTPVMLNADRERLSQVITNFISNAIKYSPGTNTIYVSTQADEKEATFCVEDFGIGIDEDTRQKVFEQFYRGNSDVHRTFQGMGLGLFISSEIIKQEGGKTWVDSSVGKGSKFYFSLPFIA
jgi:PAS domain S-box-containing protein